MAFFSIGRSHGSQLQRNRSTSASRDCPSRQVIADKSIDETSFRKHSSHISTSPSAPVITPEPLTAPPLPTPVTAGFGSRSRTAGTRDASPDSYDQPSILIPFTKSTKRVSRPPFSSLVTDVPSTVEAEHSSSPRATVNSSEQIFTSSSRTAPSSPSPIPSASPVKNVPASPEELYSGCGLSSPSPSHVERPRPLFSQRIAAVLPSKPLHPTLRTPNLDTGLVAPPLPVSPLQGRRIARPVPIPIPPASHPGRLHSRSRSATNSPTAYVPGSGPGSAKSSSTRFPSPNENPDIGEASYPGSASGSGKSTPSQEAVFSKPREKRSRNVLRKRSITGGGRHREPESAPASDSEKKINGHRPRSRSVVFPSRRDTSGPTLGNSQPLPAIPIPTVDLTPAKEILVAYKESHRDSFSRDTSLLNSGEVVAVCSEEEINPSSPTSPWSSGWKGKRKGKRRSEEQDAGEKSGTGLRSLKRKLSGKRSDKELSKRRDDPTRSVSESTAEVSERNLTPEVNRSATTSNDTRPSASPPSGQSPGQGRRCDHDEGRVWDVAGQWVGKCLRDTETEVVSNSSRLWKLVKRLSSGNLREKVNSPYGPLPPVPPLPKDLSRKRDLSPSEVHDFHTGEVSTPQSAVPESPGGTRHFITSIPSLSIPRSETDSGLGTKQTSFHHHQSQLDSGAGMSPTLLRINSVHRLVTPGTAIQMRRTATTRSSSPSSETTKFFSRSRSSSSSSYGDSMAPPIPSIPSARSGKHTPSPREHRSSHHGKGDDTLAMEWSPSGKSSTPSSPRASDKTSPTIPLFEAHHPINKFLPYRKRPLSLSPYTTSHFPDQTSITPRTEKARSTSPPAIPKKNPRRPGYHSVSIPSLPAQQHSDTNVILVQDSDEFKVADGDAFRLKRRLDSGQIPSIPKARPRSTSDGAIILEPERYTNTANSTLTFREMTKTQRQLTEKEKNAKWEDLLQRSDKAGGTLHVGSPISEGLWSDRSSVALSVSPSEASDSID